MKLPLLKVAKREWRENRSLEATAFGYISKWGESPMVGVLVTKKFLFQKANIHIHLLAHRAQKQKGDHLLNALKHGCQNRKTKRSFQVDSVLTSDIFISAI